MQSRSRYPYSADGVHGWSSERPWLDPFLSLSLVGANTREMRLGSSVVVLPLRHPLALAKTAGTLDHLFSGRLILGVGAGWLAEEFALVGQPFQDRFARTAEGVEVMRACWRPNPVEFDGTYFHLPPFAMSPKPAQGDRVPILVGGEGDRSLKLAAQVGDGWYPLNLSPAEYEQRLRKLEVLMAEAGRRLSDLVLAAAVGGAAITAKGVAGDYASIGVSLMVLDVDYSSAASAEGEVERLSLAVGL
jgi:probable F420-dependent oxidoreductase